MGESVRVIALRYPHRRDRYQAFGVDVYSLGYGQARGLRRFVLWWDALRLIRRLHHYQPFDVLHGMWADETGLLARWAGRQIGVPSVVSILGGELVALRDIGYGGQRSLFGRWIVRQALGADRVVVPSRYVENLIEAAGYHVPAARLARCVLGTETNTFVPAEAAPDPRRLIHVASLVPVKDQVTLLNAVALLPDVTLDIVGKGSEEARLRALANQLGISSRVTFHGAVDYLALPPTYRRSGMFVLTSRHETICIAALEAAASGLPVVTTAVGLLPEYPEVALTVPVGDAQATATAIRSLIDQPARYEAMRRAARERAVRDFDISGSAAALVEVYRGAGRV